MDTTNVSRACEHRASIQWKVFREEYVSSWSVVRRKSSFVRWRCQSWRVESYGTESSKVASCFGATGNWIGAMLAARSRKVEAVGWGALRAIESAEIENEQMKTQSKILHRSMKRFQTINPQQLNRTLLYCFSTYWKYKEAITTCWAVEQKHGIPFVVRNWK